LFDKLTDDDLSAVHRAIGLFVDGSIVKRCDFSRDRSDEEILIPSYAGKMRDGVGLVALDAMRLSGAGDHDAAVGRLAAGFRMAAHLGRDGYFLSAISAQDGFVALLAASEVIIEVARTGNALTTGRAKELAEAMEQFTEEDPFGFGAAQAVVRTDATNRMESTVNAALGYHWRDVGLYAQGNEEIREGESEERHRRASEWIDAQDTAGQWYAGMVMMFSFDNDDAVKERFSEWASSYRGLDLGLIIDLAVVDAPVMLDRCVSGRWDGFSTARIDALLEYSDSMDRGRLDVLRCRRLALSLRDAGGEAKLPSVEGDR
jgi:hypothetical protein